MAGNGKPWPCVATDAGTLPNGTRVWAAWLDAAPEVIAGFCATLSTQERERAGRFALERDRLRFVASRGLLRTLLASCLSTEPQLLQFNYTARGKPSLGGPFARSELQFSLAHADGLGLFAVARRSLVGVDLERIRPVSAISEIIERSFSARERAEVNELAGEERLMAFFKVWTRKEAWLKATGEGIAGPLMAIEVLYPSGRRKFPGSPPDDPPRDPLRLYDLGPAPGFLGALAVTTEPGFRP